jgi:hypothetical protein
MATESVLRHIVLFQFMDAARPQQIADVSISSKHRVGEHP